MKPSISLAFEIKQHAPFTALATFLAIVTVIAVKYSLQIPIADHAFHIMHPIHVIVSAITSAGIFYKYRPKIVLSLVVGIISAILIGSLSDIILPYLGATVFQMHPHFHLPIIENTVLITGAALLGSIIGISTKRTKVPHFLHVGISIFASLFYILAYTDGVSFFIFMIAVLIVFLAVLIPCCISDILLPVFFLNTQPSEEHTEH